MRLWDQIKFPWQVSGLPVFLLKIWAQSFVPDSPDTNRNMKGSKQNWSKGQLRWSRNFQWKCYLHGAILAYRSCTVMLSGKPWRLNSFPIVNCQQILSVTRGIQCDTLSTITAVFVGSVLFPPNPQLYSLSFQGPVSIKGWGDLLHWPSTIPL